MADVMVNHQELESPEWSDVERENARTLAEFVECDVMGGKPTIELMTDDVADSDGKELEHRRDEQHAHDGPDERANNPAPVQTALAAHLRRQAAS